MELRHLRYFVAVAEEGSLTMAAERRLHVAQPSLSRQIRDLEYAVGTPLLTRGVQGVALTKAGEVFLQHARVVLTQMDGAVEAARRAAEPERTRLSLGFLTGQEMDWLAEAMGLLHADQPSVEISVVSQYSPDLAQALARRRLDAAFMRPEADQPDLLYRTLITEKLMLVLPSDHRLAARKDVAIAEIAGETLLPMSATAPVLRHVTDAFLRQHGVSVVQGPVIDNLGMMVSLVASTRAVALLPAYALNFLPWSVVSRPLRGPAPGIDLVIGWHRANDSKVLHRFLAQGDDLARRVTARLKGR